VDARNAKGGVRDRVVEILPLDDRDDPLGAEQAYAAAIAARADAVVAASTGRTVDALVARARKGKVPVLLVGSAPPLPRLDLDDPVAFCGPWPVDQAIWIANSLLVPARAFLPGFVVEDTRRGREAEAALRRNLGPRQHAVGTAWVAPGGAPAEPDLLALRAAKCDRLVLVGEPDLVDRTVEATAGARWDVPLLAAYGMGSRAATSLHDGRVASAWLVGGAPQLVADNPPRELMDAHDAAAGTSAPLPVRTLAAHFATDLLLRSFAAAAKEKPAEVVAALREERYGPSESKTPLLDACGYASLWRWRLWRQTPAGPEPVPPTHLPAEGFGPLLRMRSPALYRAEPGTKVVWVTFGDEKSRPPRTIDRDLSELGLSMRGYEPDMDAWVRDELLARAIGKLNRLFLRNEDGTAVPGVSFAISFTTERPADLRDAWTMVIAGDDPDAGGRAFPGERRAEVYATFLERTIFRANRLEPRLDSPDKPHVGGTYEWSIGPMQHFRADSVRALVDGYAGSFALTGAHELGHVAGLGHDTSDPRSIMNVAEGVGLRETQAIFIPAHAAVLERVLGRVPAERRR
jgi:ABC-type branched-subunit amino acid transport system substrate-binding protein